MSHAAKQRFAAEGIKNKDKTIKFTEEFYDELMDLPYKSCKYHLPCIFTEYYCIERNGKAYQLLK